VLTEGIAVAVGAFVLVITLDVTRRENDRKVLAVKLQMQELMMLRNIRDSSERGRDGVSVAERLAPHMQIIAQDIKTCASACDAYLKKGFLSEFHTLHHFEIHF
jgi:hypothetical protein